MLPAGKWLPRNISESNLNNKYYDQIKIKCPLIRYWVGWIKINGFGNK